MNGVTKNQLTAAAARALKTADQFQQQDVKKFSAHTVENDVAISPAHKCKRLLEMDGTQGAKRD